MSWRRDFFTLSAHQKPNVGDIKTSVVSVDHLGWLFCDGRFIDTSEYGLLFYEIGYTFGGSGNTFRLPDGRGRVVGNTGSSGGTNWQYGQTTGEETHLMTLSELVSHNHTVLISTTGVTVNSNATGVTNQTATTGVTNQTATTGVTTQTAGSHSHTTNAIGGQGNAGLALADGTNTVESTDASSGELNVWTTPLALTVNSNGDHTHAITDPGHTHTVTDPGHTHTITDPQHNHAITDPGHIHDVTNTGGSTPFNVMQPTIFMGNMFIYSGKTNAGAWPYTIGTNVK